MIDTRKQAYDIVRNLGYEPYDATPITNSSKKWRTNVVAVRAIKENENYLFRVSTQQSRVLTNDLIVTLWVPAEPNRYNFGPHRVLDVKKFSRPIK